MSPLPHASRRPVRALAALSAALLLVALLAAPASAHVELETSDPADGATVTGTPDTITLTFGADLDPAKSGFDVRDASGVVARGTADPSDPRVLVLATPDLAPGGYLVEWHVAGSDGHLERGRLTFTVAAPTPAPTATATAAPSEAPSASLSASPAPAVTPSASPDPAPATAAAGTGDILLPIVGVVVIIGALGAFLLRRSRTG